MSSENTVAAASTSGTSLSTMRLARPSADRSLADAGFADEQRIVLLAAAQHLNGAIDLGVASDHRIDLALARPSC